ncbi:MAG: site-specific integrase [Bacteroidales bacterium]|nr:site-specific integrase [Bacteroidales bacterium]
MKLKEPVRIRERELAGGNRSLYLDIYFNGRRHYEFLKLYLIPETDRRSRQTNADTLALAQRIKSERILELQENRFNYKTRRGVGLLKYFDKLTEDKRAEVCSTTATLWRNTRNHLIRFLAGKDIPLTKIDAEWLRAFQKYLKHDAISYESRYRKYQDRETPRLGPSTAALYYQKLCACLNDAEKNGLLDANPVKRVKALEMPEGHRNYLTIEELRTLIETPIEDNRVRRMFLFSCLTGLRWSDIRNMKWGQLTETSGMIRYNFIQQKTRKTEYLDLNPQVTELLGRRRDPECTVFDNITNSVLNSKLAQWVLRAGIKKRITFHCARHTFAVMMLTLDTDIYTISKLLGHRQLETTQIYAKIVDSKKRAAVNRIPDLL